MVGNWLLFRDTEGATADRQWLLQTFRDTFPLAESLVAGGFEPAVSRTTVRYATLSAITLPLFATFNRSLIKQKMGIWATAINLLLQTSENLYLFFVPLKSLGRKQA